MSDDNFNEWINDLTEQEQPTCDISDHEQCDSCGS